MRNIFLIALFSMVIAAEAKAGNSFSTSQQVSSQKQGNSIKLANSSDGLCKREFPGKNGTIWARYFEGVGRRSENEGVTRTNTLTISLRVSPDVRSVLEDPPFAGKRQRVATTLKMLSINGRAIDLSEGTVSRSGTPGFDFTYIVSNYRFAGSSSLRSLKGGEKIKALFSIHGTFGKERGLAVTRVFECTIPSSTADDPFYPRGVSF
jgi:hypothetical protein